MEIPEITDVDRYGSVYCSLGEALGVAGAAPAPGEMEFLRTVTTPDRFDFGMLAAPDIFFAGAVTSILRPRLAIEIGTASGSSAAIIAKMIALREAQAGLVSAGPLVHTIDKKAHYVVDPAKPAGFAIAQMTPELRDRIIVHVPHDSSHCCQIVRQGLTFAFVDGNHRHPWPLLDVLRVQQLMESGWILLHDVDLPGLIDRAAAAGETVDYAPDRGARYVFDFWPYEKIRAGNIGVIRIPADRASLGSFLARMRDLPAEVTPGNWGKHWRLIDQMIQPPPPRNWLSRRLRARRA